ncbi:hypothetical protein [Streptomyces flaveolus]|uniref:hypothetical protein n=1 Tax=Streptomyces flaveolus TaxID=67297 RepID=UPI0034061512
MAKIYTKSELAALQPEPCPKCGTPGKRTVRDVTGPYDVERSYSVEWRCPVKDCTAQPKK